MAKFIAATVLKHATTKDDTPEEVSFEEGTEVTVMKEWERHYLIQDSEGKLFNVKKDLIDPD